jgi:ketosteroid isomerase-like protein
VGVLRQRTKAMGRDTSGSFRVSLVAARQPDGWRVAHVQLSGPMIAPGEMPSFAR